eukprot:TRINITY_DN4286_c0_g2_i2.p1 TRINITY_DN4286_c0_g2~~TRINITY_DN4286_c0_g2_i2.p1  ORF type:complete len:888 (-),score=118.99 TRINITY_DN4286_c0_g2_i2:276-2939(-)
MESQKDIIVNNDFSDNLSFWNANSCYAFVSDGSNYIEGIKPKSGDCFAVVFNRTAPWQGLEQDITSRVLPNVTYNVSALVRIAGSQGTTEKVQATLKLENFDESPTFQYVASSVASSEQWQKLGGTFLLSNLPKRVTFYLEGPSAGVDLLINKVHIFPTTRFDTEKVMSFRDEDDSVIQNPIFNEGLDHWTGRNCKIVLCDAAKGETLPSGGQHYAVATGRTQTWNGIQQDITGRIQRKSAYEVTALVKISANIASSQVLATVYIQTKDLREQYITMGRVDVSSKEWVQLQGRFLLNPEPVKAIAYLEGPPPGVDILVCSFVIRPAKKTPPSPPPIVENPAYGVNVLENSDLLDGTKGWFPLGPCTINVATGSPHILPPTAQESLGCDRSLSGNFILTTNRTQTWQGPAQIITDKLKVFVTYQVSAWVRVSSVRNGAQNVNVAISVDNQWNNGGEVEADEHVWKEVMGSIRLEKKPSNVMIYVQGPSPGVDLMVAGLQVFAVDREARFLYLKEQTEKLRMRDVILKISGSKLLKWCLPIKIIQINRSFPLGSCINRSSIDNDDYAAFFVEHFNWAVFENELKWTWTEPQKGQYNYRDADELLEFCNCHCIKVRGHCIFWEVAYTVQQWVKDLNQYELRAAIQNRLNSLLSRYRGKFQHYDVNNEMLHGSFYLERLGKEIRSYMFKVAHQLDPSATLFVNDYHIEDGNDARSSPEKYIGLITDLQTDGAPVGGIGIQGHITYPIGSIVHSALNKLATLGLPIWFTEMDVYSSNEYLRADDLEVMLREAFAHPAVEGIMLWGFWDLAMSRAQAHLVEADGTLNEAGRRFLALKNEWSTNICGHSDLEGCFKFKAFHGAYEVEISTFSHSVKHYFTVDKGDSPLVIEITL